MKNHFEPVALGEILIIALNDAGILPMKDNGIDVQAIDGIWKRIDREFNKRAKCSQRRERKLGIIATVAIVLAAAGWIFALK